MSLWQLESEKYNLETKEEIRDYSYKLLTERIKNLWISQKFPFDSKRMKFLEESYFASWRYFIEEDFVAIDIASWFNIKTIVHELTHAFSSWKRNGQSSDNYEAFAKSFILNEWTTDLIALDILKDDKNIIQLWNYTEETKTRLISKMRNSTASKIKNIRESSFSKINVLRNDDDEYFKNFNLSMIESHKKMMKTNSDFTLSNYKHDEDRLINETQYESWYNDYVSLIENILKEFSIFYNKDYENVFTEWQQDYFNWNYDKIVNQLKEVFGNFDEKFLEWVEKENKIIKLKEFFSK